VRAVKELPTIGFRPLIRADFPALSGWLAEPDVLRWWPEPDNDLASLEAEYGEDIDGDGTTDVFVILVDDEPAGLIQRYATADEPSWAAVLTAAVPRLRSVPTAGIDYLLGPARFRGRGIGSRAIEVFTARLFHDLPSVDAVVVAVQQENVLSWRALERAAYERLWAGQLDSDDPSDAGPAYLMIRWAPGAGP
jgi:aminoglycoside 6'-N-acetyltransferase